MVREVKQRDLTDCGAACLASVARHYGSDISVARARQLAGTGREGTSLKGMMEAAVHLGFEAKAVRGTAASLKKIPLPAIAHIVLDQKVQHYVVLTALKKDFIQVMDPAEGRVLKKSLASFVSQWEGILLILAPGKTFRPLEASGGFVQRFTSLLLPHRAVLLQTLVGALLFTVLGLSMAVYVQKIVDFVIVQGNRNLLNLMSVGMIVILIFQYLIGCLKDLYTLRTGQMIDARLILSYYKHILKLPQSFFDSMKVGEITSRISDAVKIRLFINDILVNLAVNFCMVGLALVMMFTSYWKLAAIILLVVPFYLLVYLLTNMINKRVLRTVMECSSELESCLVESLTSAGTIKRFGLEEHWSRKLEQRFLVLLGHLYHAGKSSIFSGLSTEVISRLISIVLLWAGTGFVLQNLISPGELLSFYTLIAYFTGPVSSMVAMNKVFRDAGIATERLFELMDLKTEKANEAGLDIKAEHLGIIRFENVQFRYGANRDVLKGLNLEIQAGRMTAIIGQSGSGKSSILSLLQAIYQPSSGRISIGDISFRDIRITSLRKLIAVVPQQIDLFSGSVADNIALGDERPDMDRLLHICKKLGILEFVNYLPYGFATMVGERGLGLSGGQRQRIALARALYRQPEVLLLDEATSALDPLAERLVMQAMEDFVAAGKTLIVVSHRLKLVRNADHVYVLKQGQVTESGSPEELMRRRGEYYDLVRQQDSAPDPEMKLNLNPI